MLPLPNMYVFVYIYMIPTDSKKLTNFGESNQMHTFISCCPTECWNHEHYFTFGANALTGGPVYACFIYLCTFSFPRGQCVIQVKNFLT